MKTFCAALLLLLLTIDVYPQEYTLKKDAAGNGGNSSSWQNMRIAATVGQTTMGNSSSSGFIIHAGFWPGEGIQGGPCEYVVGDVNGSDSYNGLDITYGVAFFKGGLAPVYECDCGPNGTWYVAGDVNASCSYNGLDITYGVAYFKGGTGPIPCGDCPPAGVIAAVNKRGSAKIGTISSMSSGINSQQTDKSERKNQAGQKYIGN